MENIHDWCISRQLWWGHRIPAWHCADCHKITVARVDPTACAHCGSAKITQETDVLDTWFSSGLLPVSVFGWPNITAENRADFDAFYPTSLLVTGFDILFFWVARMIMLGCWFAGDVPMPDGSPRTLADSVPSRWPRWLRRARTSPSTWPVPRAIAPLPTKFGMQRASCS
jgi:valyl-tRNA synthetase